MLKYKHIETMSVEDAVGYNLRFTLSVPGVDCALVGTKDPDHWKYNLRHVHMGPLPHEENEVIRARWQEGQGAPLERPTLVATCRGIDG